MSCTGAAARSRSAAGGRDELIPIQRAFFEVCRRLGFPEVADHNHPAGDRRRPVPAEPAGPPAPVDRDRLPAARPAPAQPHHPAALPGQPGPRRGDRAVGVDIAADGAARTGPRAAHHPGGRRDRLAGDPAALGHRAEGRAGRPGHRAGGGSSRRRRGPDRSPGHPAAAGPASRAAATRRPRSRRWSCATRPPARTSSTTCSRSCSATSTWRGIGGQQAVAAVGTPLAIGLPVALERPHARGRLRACQHRPARPAADPAQLRRRPGGPAPARRRRPPRLADRAPAGDRPPHRPRRPADRGDDGLGRRTRGVRPRDRLHPVPSLRHGPDGPADDPMAVVDQHCRLRAIPNLRVVDASVMPTIPRANINLTCIMIGEHVSDWMRDEACTDGALQYSPRITPFREHAPSPLVAAVGRPKRKRARETRGARVSSAAGAPATTRERSHSG